MDLSSKEIESYKLDLIKQINKYRADHGSQKLINEIKIDKISQQFASKLAKTGKLDFSSNEYKGQILGESVYKSDSYVAPIKLAKILYDEISEYDYKSKDPEPNNFTQMVWKSTDFIGFGIAKNKEGKYFYVINYFPTGNIDGEFKKNVLPLGTKLTFDVKNNKNKKKEICKNDDDDDNNFNEEKYYVKKVVKEINYSDDFDKDFEDFDKDFENDNNDDDEDNIVEIKTEKKVKETTNNKNSKNMMNILAELIKNKKKENSKINNNTNKTKKYEEPNYSSSSNNTTSFNKFCIEALESHNKYRKIHKVPPLTLNKDICNIAENYAKTLALKLRCLQHSENTYNDEELGENLYCCYGMDANGESVSSNWYNEIKKYNFNGDWQGGCGHFTQMVWKDTKEVGFGKCRDKGGNIYVVANYYPAGNVLGYFKYNVSRP